jgi:pentose-5-phosphate-3-epimerase
MFQTEIVERIKTKFYILYPFLEYRAICEIMWINKGTAGQATYEDIIRRMRIVSWITKGTNVHSEYVIFIAFPLHRWLYERT